MTEEKLWDTCRKMVERLAVAPTDPISNLTPGQKETIASLLFVAFEKGREEARPELEAGGEAAQLVIELRQKLTASEAENRRNGGVCPHHGKRVSDAA